MSVRTGAQALRKCTCQALDILRLCAHELSELFTRDGNNIYEVYVLVLIAMRLGTAMHSPSEEMLSTSTERQYPAPAHALMLCAKVALIDTVMIVMNPPMVLPVDRSRECLFTVTALQHAAPHSAAIERRVGNTLRR